MGILTPVRVGPCGSMWKGPLLADECPGLCSPQPPVDRVPRVVVLDLAVVPSSAAALIFWLLCLEEAAGMVGAPRTPAEGAMDPERGPVLGALGSASRLDHRMGAPRLPARACVCLTGAQGGKGCPVHTGGHRACAKHIRPAGRLSVPRAVCRAAEVCLGAQR